MIVAAHQPNFLPWLGFFDKMASADLFVSVDHVQFERQGFQTRARVRTGEGPRWLTVPVVQASRQERISDKRVDNSRCGRSRWGRKMFLTLKYAYQGAPYFSMLEPSLLKILDHPWERLADLNHAFIELLRAGLDIRTPMVRSSELGVSGVRSEMVLDLCRRVGADVYLAGAGASKRYLDLPAFEKAGIKVRWQEFTHPVYPQHPPGPFEERLAALDLLANCGPAAAGVLRGASLPEPRRGVAA